MRKSITRILIYAITGFLVIVLIYSILIEPYQIDVNHITIQNSNFNKTLQNRIAIHLTDLHISKIGRREKKILKIIDKLKPDMIFLTGDFVKWGCNYDPSLKFLAKLQAKIGIWAVMGDYDYNCSRKSCLFCHEKGSGTPTTKHKVTFFRNEIKRVPIEDDYIYLGSIDTGAEFNHTPKEIMNSLDDVAPAIILTHNPLTFDLIDMDKDILMLAGDTHGGQLPLPAWVWSILGYEKCARYNQGFFQKGLKKMYVNRGTGTSHFPIRFWNAPELLVIHF